MPGSDDGAIDAIEWIIERVLDGLAREDGDRDAGSAGLTLLLRTYCATDRAELAEALGPALARAAERAPSAEDPLQHAGWLMLFAEASAVSDDDRIRVAAADRVFALRQLWGRAHEVEPLALSIDACLIASDGAHPPDILPDAIDELERVVGGAYRPGAGIAARVNEPGGIRGRLGDHVRAASALLTAFSHTGRLPYAMLAEELMQFARQTLWDDRDGGFFEKPAAPVKPFALNCEASRVLCRLALLHDTPEYSAAAVLAPGADYGRDAARALAAMEPSYRDYGGDAAVYALALGEWRGLR